MTIEKGQDWGSRGSLGGDAPIVAGDRALAELFTITRHPEGSPTLTGPAHVGLLGPDPTTANRAPANDLARTVSARGTAHDLRNGERTQLPIDLAVVRIDETDVVMAASLVIRRPYWLGAVEGAMNASFLGEWNVTPRGHPNDGRLDVVRAELSLGDRWKARSRLTSGSHVPHPDISVRRLKTHNLQTDSRATVRIDGVDHGHRHSVSFVVVPDAVTITI